MTTATIIPFGVPLAFLVAFFVSFKINRAKLLSSFLLSCALLSLTLLLIELAFSSDSPAAKIILAVLMLLFFLLATFGVYFIVAFLVLNTYSIVKKENLKLSHILTLITAIGIIAVVTIPSFINLGGWPYALILFIYSLQGLAFYYFFHVSQYLLASTLCNLSRPKKNQDYIIVLGSQVKDGEVTPLLASRVDAAIAFYNKQEKTGSPPKLLFSGGQGYDETCSEAEAMKKYALRQKISSSDILLEDKATTTLQSMKFCKKIMDEHSYGKPYNCIYATNNYHVLRAGMLARQAGLKINGIGSKTRLYFLPNAILREYIAYLSMHKKWNIAFAVLSLALGMVAIPVILRALAGV